MPRYLAAAAVLVSLATLDARAGQVRVNTGGGSNIFLPGSIPLNQGDQVVWVWTSGGHDVISGIPGDPGAGTLFQSNLMNGGNNAFSWKANQIGTLDYFCSVHASTGMVGQLQISASGTAVSSFRITEVQYNEATGKDRIEITNMGGDFGDFGRYRISVNGGSVPVPANSKFVGSAGRVTIHTNETGTDNATNLFIPAIGDLPNTGSFALYVPNTNPGTALTDADQIIDFVQWGAGSQPNLATAMTAGVWPTSEFLDAVPSGYSLVFCGTVLQYGKSFWDVAQPNFGTQNLCATPAKASSWGRIKALYR